MKKTKVIVKKDSKKSTKQKQKQSVNVNVHIDQSKRTTQRKAKQKPDSAVNPTTTLPHGENYVKSYIPSLPPVRNTGIGVDSSCVSACVPSCFSVSKPFVFNWFRASLT